MEAGRLYREGTVRGASPVALVARLYEQMIEDLRRAAKALEQNQIELRTSQINHAIVVLGYLQSQLNLAAGGKVAEQLGIFYDALRSNLTQAQLQQSEAILHQQIKDLLTVREAWIEVEQAEKASALARATRIEPNPAPSEPDVARVDWKG